MGRGGSHDKKLSILKLEQSQSNQDELITLQAVRLAKLSKEIKSAKASRLIGTFVNSSSLNL